MVRACCMLLLAIAFACSFVVSACLSQCKGNVYALCIRGRRFHRPCRGCAVDETNQSVHCKPSFKKPSQISESAVAVLDTNIALKWTLAWMRYPTIAASLVVSVPYADISKGFDSMPVTKMNGFPWLQKGSTFTASHNIRLTPSQHVSKDTFSFQLETESNDNDFTWPNVRFSVLNRPGQVGFDGARFATFALSYNSSIVNNQVHARITLRDNFKITGNWTLRWNCPFDIDEIAAEGGNTHYAPDARQFSWFSPQKMLNVKFTTKSMMDARLLAPFNFTVASLETIDLRGRIVPVPLLPENIEINLD